MKDTHDQQRIVEVGDVGKTEKPSTMTICYEMTEPIEGEDLSNRLSCQNKSQ